MRWRRADCTGSVIVSPGLIAPGPRPLAGVVAAVNLVLALICRSIVLRLVLALGLSVAGCGKADQSCRDE